ncbi:MAG: hypothetical protein E6X17_16875 [Sporomusaceae bacterium]|nr:hypothetical protein [Sporomusaceae bacterium]
MKKSTVSALLAALVLTVSANTGLAAEAADNSLSVTGEATLHWERGKVKGEDTAHTGEQTFILNFNQPLSDKFSLYTRFAYRHFSGDDNADSIHELDQYGLIYQTETDTLKLGSQDLEFGTAAALVDLTEVGRKDMFRGANWLSETEHRTLNVIIGKADGQFEKSEDGDRFADGDDKTVFGLTLGKTFGDVTVSGEYLHVRDAADAEVPGSVYGLGLATSADKWDFSLAGLKSSANSKNTGVIADVTYNMSDTDTLSAIYRNFQDNAVVGGLATYDPGTKGVELVWAKSLSDRWGLELSHERVSYKDGSPKERVTYIETTYSF